jgi:predicted permease
MNRVRLGPWLVSAVIHFLLGGVWFTVFAAPWLEGVGKTEEQLMQQWAAWVPYVVAFVANLGIAYVLARVISTGEQSVAAGVRWGATLGIGVALAAMVTESMFEARPLAYMLIAAGYPVVGMMLMGAILGAWKGKPRPLPS